MKQIKIAWVHKDSEATRGELFDLPGCATSFHTFEKTKELPTGALALHLKAMASSGKEFPEPSPVDAVVVHPDICDAIVLLGVKTLLEQAGIQVPSLKGGQKGGQDFVSLNILFPLQRNIKLDETNLES